MRRFLVAAVLCLGIGLIGAAPASAHATLIDTDPVDGAVLTEVPPFATLRFDETVALPPGGVVLFDATGRTVSTAASVEGADLVVALPRLTKGSYVLTWRIVSADGHPVAGSLSFAVGQPSLRVKEPPAPDPSLGSTGRALAVVGALQYLAIFVAAGLAIFLAFIVPPDTTARDALTRLRRLTTRAALAAWLFGVASLPLLNLDQRGLPLGRLLSAAAWQTWPLNATVPLLLLTAGAVVLARAPQRAAVAVGALALAFSLAWTGHTRAGVHPVLLVVTDAIHVLTAGVWLGGLVGLALTLRELRRQGQSSGPVALRFSTAAGISVAVLATAGLVLGWQLIGSWSGLVDSPYGKVLLAKVAVVAVAVGIGARNRFRLVPTVQETPDTPEHDLASASLARSAAVELALLAAVIALTGFLTNLAPRPAPVTPEPNRTGVEAVQLGDDVKALTVVTPRTVGRSIVLVQIQDFSGDPLAEANPPTLQLTGPSADLGQVPLQLSDTGTYRAEVLLPEPGAWTGQVGIKLDEFTNPVGKFSFTVTR